MANKTNLDKVKETALCLLYLDVQRIGGDSLADGIYVYHPFIETRMQLVPAELSEFPKDVWMADPNDSSKHWSQADIVTNAKACDWVRNKYKKWITEAKDVTSVYVRVRKSYKLCFLKFAKPYISKKEFSQLLGEAWVDTENPNMDANVSLSMIAQWMRWADKSALMSEEDLAVFNSLPDEFVVYRGVAVGRNPVGFSWTRTLGTPEQHGSASWFAHRFDYNGKVGYVERAVCKKEYVLAYFNTRGEDETMVDTSKLTIERMD